MNLRRATCLCLLLYCGLVSRQLSAASLPDKIQHVLESATRLKRGYLGMQIVDVATGAVLFENNADQLFVPASNTKLFTTALGLMRLGPDYRFRTTVIASREPDRDGRVAGSVSLIGDGDPNLSGRELPYRVDSPPGDGLQAIAELADQIVAKGVRRIDGDIIGDDSAYVWEPYPEAWGMGDMLWEYGAPVSALTINDNTFTVTVQPGDPASISIDPPFEFYQIDNLVRSGSPKKIRIEREPGSMQLRISGALPPNDPGVVEMLAIHDPALYAAAALREALIQRGVAIRGEAVARHQLADEPVASASGFELARRESAAAARGSACGIEGEPEFACRADSAGGGEGEAWARDSGSRPARDARVSKGSRAQGRRVSGERRLGPGAHESGDARRRRQAARIRLSVSTAGELAQHPAGGRRGRDAAAAAAKIRPPRDASTPRLAPSRILRPSPDTRSGATERFWRFRF